MYGAVSNGTMVGVMICGKVRHLGMLAATRSIQPGGHPPWVGAVVPVNTGSKQAYNWAQSNILLDCGILIPLLNYNQTIWHKLTQNN